LAEVLELLQDDAQGLAELALLGQEALWQLQRIINTTHSKWPALPASQDAGDICVVQWRDACASRLGQEPAAVAAEP